jgi:S1-C subfamily serine protease
MKSLRWVLVAAAFGFALAAKAAENARQIASATFPSIVLLVMEDERGQPVALGSGFFVKDKVIASNFHVVEKATRGYAKLVGQKTKYSISGVVGLDSKHDLVLLAVEDASASALKLGDGSKVAVGDTVFVVGNPQGLEGTFSQGIVSGIRWFEADSLLQVTAPISPGSSGGPVLNSEGQVIGVAVATFKGGQNLNFAIPSKYVDELLLKVAKPEPLSSKSAKVGKSILDELGGSKSIDGVTAGAFKWFADVPGTGSFSISLVNQLREPVQNVFCLVILYDPKGTPLDFTAVQYSGLIPPGLGKRVDGRVEQSAAQLNSPYRGKAGKVEFRILGFEIVQQ